MRSAFDSFAQNWMEKLRGSALHTGSTVKRFSTTHTEEVKPTDSVSNPYVGILHYTEESYNCSDAAHKNCTLVESTPVTEIFRYQNGKWLDERQTQRVLNSGSARQGDQERRENGDNSEPDSGPCVQVPSCASTIFRAPRLWKQWRLCANMGDAHCNSRETLAQCLESSTGRTATPRKSWLMQQPTP